MTTYLNEETQDTLTKTAIDGPDMMIERRLLAAIMMVLALLTYLTMRRFGM